MNYPLYLRRYCHLLIILVFTFNIVVLSLKSCSQREWCGQDIDQYKDYSDSLLLGKGFSASKVVNMYFVDPKPGVLYVPEILRLPGYSVLISAGRLFYDSPKIVIYFNILFYLFVLYFSFHLAKRLSLGRLSYAVLVVVGINPTLIFYTAILPSVDIFTAFCLTGFVYFFLGLDGARSYIPQRLIVVTLLAIMAIFTRQNTLLIVFGLIVALVFWKYVRKEKLNLSWYIFILVASIMSVLAWSARNYFITGYFGMTFYEGNQLFSEHIYFTPYPNKDSIGLSTWAFGHWGAKDIIDERLNMGESIPQAYAFYNKFMYLLTLDHIVKYPQKTSGHFATAVKDFFLVYPFPGEKNILILFLKGLFDFINKLFILGLALTPLLLLFKRTAANRYLLFSLWFLVLLFTLLSSFFHGVVVGNRGVLPVVSLLTLFLVVCLQSLGGLVALFAGKARREIQRK